MPNPTEIQRITQLMEQSRSELLSLKQHGAALLESANQVVATVEQAEAEIKALEQRLDQLKAG